MHKAIGLISNATLKRVGRGVYTCNSSSQKVETEKQTFKAILGPTKSSRLAWVKRNPVSKELYLYTHSRGRPVKKVCCHAGASG